MTWVRLDDGFFSNPKAVAAGKDGRALFLAACCWSASNLTDGHIPEATIRMLAAQADVRPITTQRLEEVGLWHRNGDGWIINDFLSYNKSKETVEAERAAWRVRQGKARHGKRHA